MKGVNSLVQTFFSWIGCGELVTEVLYDFLKVCCISSNELNILECVRQDGEWTNLIFQALYEGSGDCPLYANYNIVH